MEPQPQHEAQIIPFPERRMEPVGTERINGVKLPLGRLCLDDLLGIQYHCVVRLDNARHELSVVTDAIDRRFGPEVPDGAA
ncbi:MAG TPA: hypothetical protein VFH39_03860 [Candidatus Saccharimonadales bacterium]|nr:hypothetical protein [Candidatus Saccharimonadales bacterium]